MKDWLKSSKVKKGKELIPCYHGSGYLFETFNTEPINRSFSGLGATAIGAHFTEDKSIALEYPFNERGINEHFLYTVNLNISNPKKYTTFKALHLDLYDYYNNNNFNFHESDRLNVVKLFKEDLIKQGYDGITYLEGPPYNITKNRARVWVAFNTNQIEILSITKNN